MHYRDEPAAAAPMLESVLRWISLPADSQIPPEMPAGFCAPCSICSPFHWWRDKHADSPFVKGMTPDQASALEAVDAAIADAHPVGTCHDTERVRTGEGFARLRELASAALQGFGWGRGSPDERYLPGTEACSTRLRELLASRKSAQRAARLPGPALLRFHQDLCDLMGVEPATSARNVEILEERQRVLGVRFPAAVVELLSLQGINEPFHEYSGESYLAASAEEDEWAMLESFGRPDDVRQGYLHVLTDREGIVGLYVRLDEGEDPPVYNNSDQWFEDLSEVSWTAIAGAFSTGMFELVAHDRFAEHRGGFELSTTDQAPTSSLLESLRGQFREGPGTDRPERKSWNFFTPRSVIQAAAGVYEPVSSGLAFWKIAAADADALYDALKSIWRFGPLAASLKSLVAAQPSSQALASVIAQLDREAG